MADIKIKIGGTDKTFSGITALIVAKPAGGNAVFSADKTKLMTPVLTDLSTKDKCVLRFPNDTNAAYYIFYANGVLIPASAWTADLTGGIYTVTINAGYFGDGVHAITAQAIAPAGSETYTDSDLSQPILYTQTELPIPASPVVGLTGVSTKFPNGSRLSWEPVDRAAGYKIYSNGTYIQRPDETLTSYDMGTANVAGTYEITVTAYNEAGESAASNTVSFVVAAGYPVTYAPDFVYDATIYASCTDVRITFLGADGTAVRTDTVGRSGYEAYRGTTVPDVSALVFESMGDPELAYRVDGGEWVYAGQSERLALTGAMVINAVAAKY